VALCGNSVALCVTIKIAKLFIPTVSS
jgi:hypothetical protein